MGLLLPILILILTILIVFITGLPIAFVLGGVGMLYLLLFQGTGAIAIAAEAAFSSTMAFVLVAIPLFIFMGNILERSGVTGVLFDTIYKWTGSLRGGLAIGSMAICVMIAAMVGVMGAGVLTTGVIAMPEMLRRDYDKRLAMGTIMSGGALATLIPPSVPMILYALFARQSVGRMFAGGMIPGLILAFIYISYIGIRCALKPELGPSVPVEKRASWKEKFISLRGAILPLVLIVLVLGSILVGAATPTEAAAVGAFGAALTAIIYRKFSWTMLKEACYRSFLLLSMIVWILVGIECFNRLFMHMGGIHLLEGLVAGGVHPWAVLIGMQLSLIILGMFLDDYAIIMIATPIYVPVIIALGFNPIWFGIIVIVNMQIAVLTPPYGFTMFYMKGLVPEIPMIEIWKAVIPFVLLQLVGLGLVMAFPQLSLWLPELLFKGKV